MMRPCAHGNFHPCARCLLARNRRLRKVLRAIRNYEPREVAKDEFAYDRMVENYRDAARAGLEVK